MEKGNTAAGDGLVRCSMTALVQTLLPDFDKRLMREIRRGRQPLDRYGRFLLSGYGLTSVVVSAVIMRGQELDQGVVSVTIAGPLALIAATR